MDQQRLIYLLQRYHDGILTTAEAEELLSVIHDKTIESTLQSLSPVLENESFVPYIFNDGEVAARLKSILDIDKTGDEPVINKVIHRVHFLKTAWFRYAAAIILFIGLGSVIYLWNTQKERPLVTQTKPVPVKTDILPGSDRAILTLSDGKNIELDSSGKLIYGVDGIAKYADGGLIYGAGSQSSPFEKGGRNDARGDKTAGGFNTMSTPRGGQYQLTLSDGTKVWLNAASSITYPTVFTSKTREVKITGEAYFEVTPNKSAPFIVKTSKEEITVLGTSFNVNAYSDESSIKTSLIDGSVKIKPAYAKASAGEGQILKPGQAFINNKIISTNTTNDLAWKNGKFNFDGLSFQQAMRQLARWYDVEIIYEKGVPDIEIAGEIGRDLNLAQLLDGLKDLDIHYKLEGRKLIIQP